MLLPVSGSLRIRALSARANRRNNMGAKFYDMGRDTET